MTRRRRAYERKRRNKAWRACKRFGMDGLERFYIDNSWTVGTRFRYCLRKRARRIRARRQRLADARKTVLAIESNRRVLEALSRR